MQPFLIPADVVNVEDSTAERVLKLLRDDETLLIVLTLKGKIWAMRFTSLFLYSSTLGWVNFS